MAKKTKKTAKKAKKPAHKKHIVPKLKKEVFTRIEATIPKKAQQNDREQRVSKIEEGTVIDHIAASTLFKVLDILKLHQHPSMVIIASNLSSKKMGSKAIIKIEKRFLTQEEVNKISLFAPDATVSIIKGFSVKQKSTVQLPQLIENVIRCSNPSCITNHEPVSSKFAIAEKSPLKVVCRYCERPMTQGDIQIVEDH